MSATDLKNQGNKHYAARNYEAAVNCYSKAIVSPSSDIISVIK